MPTEDALRAIVHARVAEVLGVAVEEITDGTHLGEEYGIDSLELLEIGARVEKDLNIRIRVDDLVLAETVGHAVELLGAHLASLAGPSGAPARPRTGG